MINLAQTPEEYTIELVIAFSDLDEDKIKSHLMKYGMNVSDNPIVFWGSIYKTITGNKRFPKKLRRKAKKWLTKRGFKSWDDGGI